MNKQLRNKAYADFTFFICDFNGVDWLTNTYIAEPDTTPPRITKVCNWRDTQGQKPLLGKIVDVTTHKYKLLASGLTAETVRLSYPEKSNTIQRKYYDYFVNRYPEAEFKTGGQLRYEPISVYNNNELVGIIMPLKD